MIRRLLPGPVLFAGGFVLFLVLTHVLVGDPLLLNADDRSEKLAILNATEAGVCTASVGTSRVHNGYDACAFDQAFRAAGIDISPVNLAIDGGSQSNLGALANRLFPHAMDAGLYRRETAADRRSLLTEAPIDKDTREVGAFFVAGLAVPLPRFADLFKGDASAAGDGALPVSALRRPAGIAVASSDPVAARAAPGPLPVQRDAGVAAAQQRVAAAFCIQHGRPLGMRYFQF